jgi:uncharacterized membrane protein YhaH (DUF805 family)
VQNQDASNAAIAALASIWLVVVVVGLGLFVLHLIINWRIAEKAGYSGPLSLLMLIPFVNYIMLLIFAFSEWPIETRLKTVSGGLPPPSGTTLVPGTTI